jgi:small-conductance mechanosensitive channel
MDFSELFEIIKKVVEYPIFTVKQTPITLTSLFVFALFMGSFALLARFIKRLMTRWLGRMSYVEEGTRFILIRMTQYVVIIIGIIFSCQFIGLDLSGLAVIFGLLSVGIGFGLQNLVANFISGLILLFERPIRVGDRIILGDLEGDVEEINIRSTTVRAIDNNSIIVPNSEFTSNRVINWSHGDRRVRLQIDVGVSYNSDIDTVIEALMEVARDHSEALKHPAPEVRHTGFGDSAWNMRLWVWIPIARHHRRIRSELNCAIVRKFREKGVQIPFPQRDLHVRSTVPFAVSS